MCYYKFQEYQYCKCRLSLDLDQIWDTVYWNNVKSSLGSVPNLKIKYSTDFSTYKHAQYFMTKWISSLPWKYKENLFQFLFQSCRLTKKLFLPLYKKINSFVFNTAYFGSNLPKQELQEQLFSKPIVSSLIWFIQFHWNALD